MCLILFSLNVHPEYSLIMAGNRDEFYSRPAAPLKFWKDEPSVLGGRDLAGGGTWLGVTKSLKIAALTNCRDPSAFNPDAPSRGDLVKNFLCGKQEPQSYIRNVEKIGNRYNGFNLIAGERDRLWIYSNRGRATEEIPPGFYGISNHFLDTPWPKIKRSKDVLEGMFTKDEVDMEAIFAVLEDRTFPPAEDLPDTGAGPEWERMLSPIFVSSDIYGTRSSSALLIGKDGNMRFLERTFSLKGKGSFYKTTREFKL